MSWKNVIRLRRCSTCSLTLATSRFGFCIGANFTSSFYNSHHSSHIVFALYYTTGAFLGKIVSHHQCVSLSSIGNPVLKLSLYRFWWDLGKNTFLIYSKFDYFENFKNLAPRIFKTVSSSSIKLITRFINCLFVYLCTLELQIGMIDDANYK